MKSKLLLLLFIIITQTAIAQEYTNYKDIFPLLSTIDDRKAYSILLQYQKLDPEHANTYYQLGLISRKWMREYDPLTESKNVLFFIYNAKLYFGLCQKFMDDKEIRRNGEWYPEVPLREGERKKLFEDATSLVDSLVADVEEFERHYLQILEYYTKSVNFYNQCIATFMDINRADNKIKDIYLTADNELITTINHLRSDYDSTIFYFDAYRQAIAAYPIGNYNQNYTIKTIGTYRLHGLTSSNFLKDEVPLWNYKQWTEDVIQVLNTNIAQLRKNINTAHADMEDAIKQLKTTTSYSDSLHVYSIDEKLVNTVAKFDYQSLMVSFLNYRQAKIDWLTQRRHPLAKTQGLSAAPEMGKYTNYYRNLLKMKAFTDSLNQLTQGRINDLNIEKYAGFFAENYQGQTGLKSFLQNEAEDNQQLLNNDFNNLKAIMLMAQQPLKNQPATSYRNQPLDLLISSPSVDIAPGKYKTSAVAQTGNNTAFVTGCFRKTETAPLSAFVAKITDGETQWLKTFDLGDDDAHSAGMQVAATDNGCFVAINAKNEELTRNFIVRLDADGNELLNKEILQSAMPRFLLYDDINEKLIITLKGDTYNELENAKGILKILYLDAEATTQWEKSLDFEGNMVDIIKMNNNFLLFGNFSKLTSFDNSIINSKAGTNTGETNVFAASFTTSGEWNEVVHYQNPTPCFAVDVVKVDSETINIVGLKSQLKDVKQNDSGNLLYVLTDNQGKTTFKNY